MIKRALLNEELKQAIEMRDEDLILALLKKGANVSIDNIDCISDLMKAKKAYVDGQQHKGEKQPALQNEVVLMLCKNIKTQIDKNKIDKSYIDKIIWYFVRDEIIDRQFLQLLVDMGFNPNLALASIASANVKDVEILLDLGADINYEDADFNVMKSPLQFAIDNDGEYGIIDGGWELWNEENLLKYFKFLISKGVNKKIITEALHMCCEVGYVNLAILLIKNGADINHVDGNGRNSLMNLASYQVWYDETDDLSFGYFNNKREYDVDWQQLQYSKAKMEDEKYLKARKALINKLIKETKDLTLKDNNGWNAAEISRLNNNLDIVEQMREEIKKYALENPYQV